MTWLLPIGFLGLIGVVALIIIYIIKPNYQTKFVSSTYVWRMSLKYRRNKLPISRLHNILLFICQLLILTLCGLLLAVPVLNEEKTDNENEKILIIDASASMQMTNGSETRFKRAVDKMKLVADDTLGHGGLISVIVANAEPYFLAQRVGVEEMEELRGKLDALISDASGLYGSADIDAAAALAEQITEVNGKAQVHLYTATKYLRTTGFNVVDVAEREVEWNAAVLDCTARMNENNHYEISIDLGCYGRTELVTVHCDVHGANGDPNNTVSVLKSEFFDPSEEEKTVVFGTDDFSGKAIYSFDYLEVYVELADSFADDNSYFLYGGKAPTVRIQYASSLPNLYFGGIVRTIREEMKGRFNIEFVELKANEKPATEGFDLYIFEHKMPDVIPSDGVVLLCDPNKAPTGSGISVGKNINVQSDSTLAAGRESPLTKYVDSSRITIARYMEITPDPESGFEELAYYNGMPMILAKNDPTAKIVVWAFDLNNSNLIALPDFSFLMYNMFNYYIPSTVSSHSFEIGDTVELTARGSELKVSASGEQLEFGGAEGSFVASRPGTYTVTQKSMRGDEYIVENFFVRIPNYESNITKEVDELPIINAENHVEVEYRDLLFYFAIILVALLFVEWYLHSRKNNI